MATRKRHNVTLQSRCIIIIIIIIITMATRKRHNVTLQSRCIIRRCCLWRCWQDCCIDTTKVLFHFLFYILQYIAAIFGFKYSLLISVKCTVLKTFGEYYLQLNNRSLVNKSPTRCSLFHLVYFRSTCFGHGACPSSGVVCKNCRGSHQCV